MRNFTSTYRIIIVLFVAFATFMAKAQNEAPMMVTAKADSTNLIMGDRTTVNVEVIKNRAEGALVGMPQREKDYYGLEMVECTIDSTDLGNGRTQLNYRFIFQAFDPAEVLTLPGFRYAVAGDTVSSDILTFKVLPVELSPELGDPNDIENLKIHPDELTVTIPSRWYDYVPDWIIWVILGLAIVALGVILYLLYKKNGPKIFVARKPIPPYELALQQLRKLKDKHLIENGMAKQFYTEVTDIWRSYLEGRFGISAMEMTSRQILQHLRHNPETHLSAQQMEQILELSDFVKFAAMNPSREDMVKTYNTIYDFVEATRPAPEPEETETKAKNQKSKKK